MAKRRKYRHACDAALDAEKLLPGTPAPEGEIDPRWQAIIEVGEFIPSEPDAVWRFISKWGRHADDDLRSAIATCLLEHLLDYHFDPYFAKVETLARSNSNFAQTFLMCWKFGQAAEPKNAKRFAALRGELDKRRRSRRARRSRSSKAAR